VDTVREASYRGAVLRSVIGNEVEIEQSAVRDVRGDEVEVEQSALVYAAAQRLKLTGSSTVALVARDIEARNVNTVFLLSPRVRGTVRTVFDMRSAFAFGLGIVIGRQVLRLLRVR